LLFNNSKDTDNILDALNKIELFIKSDTNSIKLDSNKCSGKYKLVMEKIINISQLIESKQKEDLTIYGEIMLCAEKLSDGFTNDRITKQTSNLKLNYITKTINIMS